MASSHIQWLDGSGIDDSPLIWAENEPFQQIKTSQILITKTVARGGKHHLVEQSPRINTISSETIHFFWGIMESWYRLISLSELASLMVFIS